MQKEASLAIIDEIDRCENGGSVSLQDAAKREEARVEFGKVACMEEISFMLKRFFINRVYV